MEYLVFIDFILDTPVRRQPARIASTRNFPFEIHLKWKSLEKFFDLESFQISLYEGFCDRIEDVYFQ